MSKDKKRDGGPDKPSKGVRKFKVPGKTVSREPKAQGSVPIQSTEDQPAKVEASLSLHRSESCEGYYFALDHRRRLVLVQMRDGKPIAVEAKSKAGRGLLREGIYKKSAQVPKKIEINELIEALEEVLEAKDLVINAPYRIASIGHNNIVIDAFDGRETRYHITCEGVAFNTPEANKVVFQRSATAEPLICGPSGDLLKLKQYLNVDDRQFWLLVCWVGYTLSTPKLQGRKFVHVVINGSEGSGKSFASVVLQSLIDPQSTKATAFPKSEKLFAIALSEVHIALFDNMRSVGAIDSDRVAMASSRAVIPGRRLYTDGDQYLMTIHGACVFNGIYGVSQYPDFIQRCLNIQMTPVESGAYVSETELLASFEQDQPSILRGVLELISDVFKYIDDVEVQNASRMVDWHRFLVAAGKVLDVDFDLADAYLSVVSEAQLDNLHGNTLASAFIQLAHTIKKPEWSGTATKLFDKLSLMDVVGHRYSRDFPHNATSLGKRLNGIKASLAQQGIWIEMVKGKERIYVIKFAPLYWEQPQDDDGEGNIIVDLD